MVTTMANHSDVVYYEMDTSNETTLPPDMVFGEAQIISISVYSVLFVSSGVMNLRLLLNLLRAKRHVGLSRLNYLLLQLVLADLMVTFLMMPLEIIWAATVSWKGGDFLCRICAFFRIFGLFLSSHIVICISIDRFLAILKPFSVRSSSKRTNRMLWVAWGLAVALSLPQCFVFRLQYHPKHRWYGQCVTYGAFQSRQSEFLYFLLGMVFLYILPLIIIIVTYGGIVYHLHKKGVAMINARRANSNASGLHVNEDINTEMCQSSEAPMSTAHGRRASNARFSLRNRRTTMNVTSGDTDTTLALRQSTPGNIGKAKLNTIRITLTIVGVFLACWTPYYFMCMWYWIDSESFDHVDVRIRKFLFLFACTNSCANPLIYGVFSSRSGSNGVFASRDKDVTSSEQARRGWIGNQKVRLAGRRRSTMIPMKESDIMTRRSRGYKSAVEGHIPAGKKSKMMGNKPTRVLKTLFSSDIIPNNNDDVGTSVCTADNSSSASMIPDPVNARRDNRLNNKSDGHQRNQNKISLAEREVSWISWNREMTIVKQSESFL